MVRTQTIGDGTLGCDEHTVRYLVDKSGVRWYLALDLEGPTGIKPSTLIKAWTQGRIPAHTARRLGEDKALFRRCTAQGLLITLDGLYGAIGGGCARSATQQAIAAVADLAHGDSPCQPVGCEPDPIEVEPDPPFNPVETPEDVPDVLPVPTSVGVDHTPPYSHSRERILKWSFDYLRDSGIYGHVRRVHSTYGIDIEVTSRDGRQRTVHVVCDPGASGHAKVETQRVDDGAVHGWPWTCRADIVLLLCGGNEMAWAVPTDVLRGALRDAIIHGQISGREVDGTSRVYVRLPLAWLESRSQRTPAPGLSEAIRG